MSSNLGRALFDQQRWRRFGQHNPERIHMAHWEHMVRTRASAYEAREAYEVELADHCSTDSTGPLEAPVDWCFQRFGTSRTRLADGRVIYIGGEYEDWYDPDFCIYNDVIVTRPEPGQESITESSGEIEIYGYPSDIFPPTDSHSATRVGKQILIIGGLGYPELRSYDCTPVFALDLDSHRIVRIATIGRPPGLLYKHSAAYDPQQHALVLRSGFTAPERIRETPNRSVYKLHLGEMYWDLVAQQDTHHRYRIYTHHRYERHFAPDALRPQSISHEWLGHTEHNLELNECEQLMVAGVRVNFDWCYREVGVLVEGQLAPELVRQMLGEIAANLQASTGLPWVTEVVRPKQRG